MSRIPIIDDSAAMLEIANGLGAQKTLPKPFQAQELIQAVSEALAS